jgi:hypothetical protein
MRFDETLPDCKARREPHRPFLEGTDSMRKHLGKKLAAAAAATVVVMALAAGSAFAAPVLPAGKTSGPHNGRGTCSNCHTYAAPAPAAKPVTFSRPFTNGAKHKSGRPFGVNGYFAPSLASATNATVTIGVERLSARGHWVATRSFNQTATVSATGKYAGKVSYKATMKIKRLGKFRLRAKLAYLDANGVSHLRFSKPTIAIIKK